MFQGALVMRLVLCVAVILLSISSCSKGLLADSEGFGLQGEAIQYDFGHQYTIRSEILSEDRKLLIYVPEEYHQKPSEQFPVIYVLEGNLHFQHAVISVEKIQKSGWIPASIIVGVADNDDTDVRDYRQRREKFQRFISEEIQLYVAENYRASTYKTVFAHGFAGTFAVETFISNPDAFDNYIIANPYIRQDTLDRLDAVLAPEKDLDQSLYFSMGTVSDNGPYNVEPVENMAALLKEKAPTDLQWHYEYLTLHGVHGSANVTLFDGLSQTFKDYQGPFIESYQDYVDGGAMVGVKAYFAERAKKYGISDEIDVGTFMGLGFMFMDNGYPKEAIELLDDAIAHYYPNSVQLYRVLGRAYIKLDDYRNAEKAYEKMVLLAKQQNHPRLDGFESLLEQIKAK